MSLAAITDPNPVRMDADGTARIGSTRVRLASVLYHHRHGATPEEIQKRFPSISLADVYAAIAYYLHHQVEVDAYLADSEEEAERIRREIESRPETKALREKLRARRP
jgi:uncharacterized protein (DUF433 family)